MEDKKQIAYLWPRKKQPIGFSITDDVYDLILNSVNSLSDKEDITRSEAFNRIIEKCRDNITDYCK